MVIIFNLVYLKWIINQVSFEFLFNLKFHKCVICIVPCCHGGQQCLTFALGRPDGSELLILSPQILHILDKCFWLIPFAIVSDATAAMSL